MHSFGWDESIVRVTVFITLPHGQLHAVFRGFVSISGVWMLFWTELPLMFLLVSVRCDTAQALMFLLVSVCCDSPSLGVLDGVSVL